MLILHELGVEEGGCAYRALMLYLELVMTMHGAG